MKINRYQAAGGIVFKDRRLLILHKHTQREYVLPKGHVEPGESAEAAALREVREETGYHNLRIVTNLGTEHVEFFRRDEHVIRDETYFLMELVDETRYADQDYDDAAHDRAVFEMTWMPLEEAEARMTFDSGRTFVRRAVEWLQARSTP